MSYVPERGDLIWLDFSPQSGHEQAGRRPALVLSPHRYNSRVGLAIVCPITSRATDYAFEVALPPGGAISGVVLADQARSVDWIGRNAEFIDKAPTAALDDVLAKLAVLLS